MMFLNQGCRFGYAELMAMPYRDRVRWCEELAEYQIEQRQMEEERAKRIKEQSDGNG
jgi:hypothetical protein